MDMMTKVAVAKSMGAGPTPEDCPKHMIRAFDIYERLARPYNSKRKPEHHEIPMLLTVAEMIEERDQTIRALCDRVQALEAELANDEDDDGDSEKKIDMRTKEGRALKAAMSEA